MHATCAIISCCLLMISTSIAEVQSQGLAKGLPMVIIQNDTHDHCIIKYSTICYSLYYRLINVTNSWAERQMTLDYIRTFNNQTIKNIEVTCGPQGQWPQDQLPWVLKFAKYHENSANMPQINPEAAYTVQVLPDRFVISKKS